MTAQSIRSSAAYDALRAYAPEVEAAVGAVMERARRAQRAFANASQEQADDAVRALAWSIYKPEHARELAELAVADTGLGNVADKIVKKQRKTFGTLRDLLRVKTVGIIEEDPARGLVKYAKPIGVVAAVTPSTNPGATPANKAMMALKGRNAIVIAPSPLGYRTTERTVDLMRAELEAVGLPADLVQILPAPVTKESTEALMKAADLVVVTGSQDNVRRGYTSGTPAIGVGVGNVPVIIDETADLTDAAAKICASKTFDNATSCSSENAVVIVDAVYDQAIAALRGAGGYLCSAEERQRVQQALWVGGKLNRNLIARDAKVLAAAFELPAAAASSRFFMVEETGVGKSSPFSGEKLSLVLAVYRARDFAAAKACVAEILDFQGRGHSLGIHTRNPERARELAEDLDVVRVLVNFAHTFGNGGGFDSGLNFTLSMGCGSWQKNSISENLSYKHFLNVTHLVQVIPPDKPSEEELFGPHWAKTGQGGRG
jgi:sulfoacetaldehyde dehydrogenase